MIKLARRAGYMLAGRASSMFARCLLDVCPTFARSRKGSIRQVVYEVAHNKFSYTVRTTENVAVCYFVYCF